MNRDDHDALIDQLLRELLGGDRPRDLTERVLARARAYDRVRLRWWASSISAVAASIAIAALLWIVWPREYPSEKLITGAVEITNAQQLQRGAHLLTNNQSAQISLGDYVNLEMKPHTDLTLGGTRFDERVLLEQGDLDVSVTRHRGTFNVEVGPAVIHVTGTRFRVVVKDEIDSDDVDSDKDIITKKLQVSVAEGSVEVRGLKGGPVALSATTDSSRIFSISAPRVVKREAPRSALGSGPRAGEPIIGRGGRGNGAATRPRAAGRGGAFALGRGGDPRPTRPFQVVWQPGIYTAEGTLRRENRTGHYFLVTEFNGNILVFPQQPILSRMPPLSSHVIVTWKDAVVQKIELQTSATRPAQAADTTPEPPVEIH
jgi:hypothetical protein